MRKSLQQELVLSALKEHGPCLESDIAAEVPACRKQVERMLYRLRDIHQAHIAKWEHTEIGERCYPRPVWKAGRGKDATKPAPMSNTERMRLVRARKKDQLTKGITLWQQT